MTTPRVTSSSNEWFTVDRGGLAALIKRKSLAAVVAELIQNAWDEQGVTEVTASLMSLDNATARLVVTDDAPNGFADLTHAYALFAKSAKIDNARQRGRFNLGEKLVLAVCDEATITSTSGGVSFGPEGRKVLRRKRDAGSEFSAIIRMSKAEVREAVAFMRTLIPPTGIATTFNGEVMVARSPLHTFEANLLTELGSKDTGSLYRAKRKTAVSLYEPAADEVATIYEMGIPVVEWNSPWHADIAQKVPLNMERDNVTPAYLRDLQVVTLNENFDRLTPEQATQSWVSDALGDSRADDKAIRTVIGHRFGEGAVAYDMRDKEANANAVLAGRQVVHGGNLNKDQWANAKRAGALQPAGQITPSLQIITAPDGDLPIDEDTWTPGMRKVADYAQRLAKVLLDIDIKVDMRRSEQPFDACYGARTLGLNVRALGRKWFEEPNQERVDALLIHEYAHERVGNHLSEEYHTELCRLAARVRNFPEVRL